MPLVKIEQINEDTKILIWHIVEPDEFFEKKLITHFGNPYPWQQLTPKRKREYLATRYLLQLGLPAGETISEYSKDKHGTPGLPGSDLYFGISHTKDFAGCIISSRRVGCDIETYQERIKRLAHRFMTEEECEWADDEKQLHKMHLIWGIKESSYKTWGKGGIDWKEDIHIDRVAWHPHSGDIYGKIGKPGQELPFHGAYQYFDDFLFVWTLEDQ